MEDAPRQVVASFHEVLLAMALAPVRFVVGQPQDVDGLEDPPEVGDGVAERGRGAVA